MSRSTPQKARQDLQNKLDLAGRPGNLTPEDFAAVRLVAAAVMAAIGLGIGFLLQSTVYLVLALAIGAILGYYLPTLWLKQKVDARRLEIQKGLPDAMDLLVIQSEQFGTGIGKILRIQADEMRRKRRQRAQEKAAQATLKMMLPMVGCIFPTLWIVLLGPAVLILMKPR
jgi:tight adherence protein C